MTLQQIQEIMQQAVIHHRSGRLGEAEQLYRRVLSDQPNYAHALHLLGLVAFQSGQSP
jgi:Flp pilus assembly protein TadD